MSVSMKIWKRIRPHPLMSVSWPISSSTDSTLQVGKSITYIDSEGSCLPKIITMVTVHTSYGKTFYHIECKPSQSHSANIGSLHVPSYPKMLITNSIIWPLHSNIATKQSYLKIGFVPHYHTPATTYVYTSSQVKFCLHQQFQPYITGCQCTMENST